MPLCLSQLEPLCVNGRGNVGIECDGGYADYIKLPAHVFIKLPEALDYKAHPAETGVITDALATPLKVLRRADVKAGETVAVIGAGGGLGIHQVMMAKWAHARVIAVDTAAGEIRRLPQGRRRRGRRCQPRRRGGGAQGIDPWSRRGCGGGLRFDHGDAGSRRQALGPRGRLVILGGAAQPFQAPALPMLTKEQSILGSRYVSRAEIMQALDLAARREVWPLVTVLRPLEEAEAVHELVERGAVTGRAALRVA